MSAFITTAPPFEAFLMRVKDDAALNPNLNGAPQNARFIPRNFLIEEHLDTSRINTYVTELPNSGSLDFNAWNAAHNAYLGRHIFVRPLSAVHDYRLIAQDNPSICPETFRAKLALIPFEGTDLDTHFIRMIPVSDLAYLANENENHIFSLGERVVRDPGGMSQAYQELSLILDYAFNNPRCEHRPIFAAFYEDFLNELRLPVEGSWPNRLRDRLGMYHINQWQPGGLPRKVFLFRYAVRTLPRHSNNADRRPIAIPVVIDHKLSESFCPSPGELDRGRLVNLQANATEEPAREVLHLFMPMQVEHLFRVGLVTEPVPDDLAFARRDHLIWMRLQSDRETFASITDP